MTRYIAILSTLLLLTLLSVLPASAQDVPEDVLRAITDEEHLTPAENRGGNLQTSDVTSDASQPLIGSTDSTESQLNRAAVRYENLARKWTGGLDDWEQRAVETLLRIDELLSNDDLIPQDDAASDQPTDASIPEESLQVRPEPAVQTVGATEPAATPAVADPTGGDDSGDARESVAPPAAANPGLLPATRIDLKKPSGSLIKSQAHKRGQNRYEDLARLCDQLSEELRRLADALRSVR